MPCCSPFLSAVSFFFFFFFHLPRSILSQERDPYYVCDQEFKCGPIKNISYPFFAYSQPDYCGWPSFRLKCENNVTRIIINHQRYSVLDIEPDTQTVKIARNGWKRYWKGNCPTQGYDISLNYVTLNLSAPFHLSSSPTSNLTLFYNCPLLKTLPTKFQCDISGIPKDAWISTDANTRYVQPELLKCQDQIAVPLIGTTILDFINSNSTIEDILKVSFKVKYSVNIRECDECRRSEGQCGYNQTTRKPTCFCGGRDYGLRCPPPTEKGSKTRRNVGIGTARKKVIAAIIAAGTLAALITMATILIWCWLRKKSNGSIILWKKKSRNGRAVEAFFKDCEFLAPRKFKYKDIKKMTNSFNDKVGQGGFGSVFKGKLPDGHMVAVKVLNETKGDGNDFINEVASISRTSHVNIVTLLGFCINGPKKALVYEFMPNGSLEKFIYGERPLQTRHLGWVELYRVAIGIARGLEYLHRGCNTRIVHFDIKPHNILLDENFIPKIADFGLSKLSNVTQSIVSMTGARGTPGYIAPELVSRGIGEVSHKSDVYSYGMMVLEMVGGRKNIDVRVTNLSEIYFPHWIHKRLDMNEGLGLHGVTSLEDHGIARKMILVGLWCIQINPTSRPPMSKVLEMLEGSLEALQLPPKPYLSSLSNEDEGSHSSVSSL